MWLMMAVEQPAMTAVIARLPDAELNLAAFGVMFSIALVIESPVLQMLSAATARSKTRGDYRQLLAFMTWMSLILTAIHVLVAITPLYGFILETLLAVPPEIAELSRVPFVIMAPFAAAVGYRRLWQGVLIRYGRTVAVPITMISRLVIAGVVLAVGYSTEWLSGAALAAVALSLGVVFAAVAAWILFRKLVYAEMPVAPQRASVTDLKDMLRFYIPLSMTSIVFLLSRPLLTFGMARAAFPVKSLAVWPVINAFLFLFNSFALSFQEAAIAILERGEENRARLSRFSGMLAALLSAGVLICALSPVSELWFRGVSGLSESLLPFTRTPLIILAVVPAMVTAKSWLRGQYVSAKRTGVLANAVVIYTVVLFVTVFLGPRVVDVAGAILAASCLSFAQLIENSFLRLRRPARQAHEMRRR